VANAPDTITIEYEFTREDYLQWAQWLRGQGEAARQWALYARWHRFLITVTALLTLLVVAAWVKDGKTIITGGDPWLLVMAVTLSAITFLCWQYSHQLHRTVGEAAIRRRIETDADGERARLWQGHKRVTITPSLMIWEARHCVWLQRWWRVRAVRKEAGFILMDLGAEGAWPIPLRVFPDEAAADRFMLLATMHRTAAPGGEREEARDLLCSRDVPCPGCGYNLRGTGGEKCPECGRKVELREVLAGVG
jgi:hypothetical protein